MEGSQFMFHMDKLVNDGLILKQESSYELTALGKDYANKMDDANRSVVPQAKLSAIQCAYREVNGERYLLIYKRLKSPFFGCQGFPTEKVEWGEKIADGSKRGLFEETGLEGEPRLFAIRHYRVFVEDKKVEDKVMYCYLFDNPKGEIKGNLEGDFEWVAEKELEIKVINPLEEFWGTVEALRSFKKEITFKEIDIVTNKF